MLLHLTARIDRRLGVLTLTQARPLARRVADAIHAQSRTTWPVVREAYLDETTLVLEVDVLGDPDDSTAAARRAAAALGNEGVRVVLHGVTP